MNYWKRGAELFDRPVVSGSVLDGASEESSVSLRI